MWANDQIQLAPSVQRRKVWLTLMCPRSISVGSETGRERVGVYAGISLV